MKRLLAAVVILFVSVASDAQAPCPAHLNNGQVGSSLWKYDITLADAPHQLLRIRMSIAPTSPSLRVQLPVWNATYQVRDFAEHVNWLRATTAEGQPVSVHKLDKTTWSVPNAVSIEYEILASEPGPFGTEFTSAHAFLNLAQVLIYPVAATNQLVQVYFANVPNDWKVATALNTQSDSGYCAENYDRLVDSPVEISQHKQIEFRSADGSFSVVIHAEHGDYDLNLVRDTLIKVTAAEIDWMDDRPFDRFTFIYHFPRFPGRGGMEHAYSTAIEISAGRLQQEPSSLFGVSAHEFFHLWNVKRIRSQALEPIDYTRENYSRSLWFLEGVTSTVGEYMLVRAGLIDSRTFLERLASEIRQLEIRPAKKTQSVEESSLDAWLEKYPYYRTAERSVSYYDKGQIVGVLLDLEMRRVTNGRKSLRDLFHYLNLQYPKQGKYFDDTDGIRSAVEAVTGVDFSGFFRRYVSGTDDISYNTFFRTVGLTLQQSAVKVADPGFTASTNFGPNPVITSVAPGSEAARASLQAGDVILAVNGADPEARIEDQIAAMKPDSTLRLKVSAKDKVREVTFKLGTKQDVYFSFEDVPNITDAQRAARAAWMRGDSLPAEER
ncbi:MAG TPA: PDZ domain-containing protein [Terriglobales bacterium]|nr:PDZ domain-containing protein [Terriglobales bacterium]